MKKIATITFIGLVVFTSCTKKHNDVSQIVTVSFPTITITGSPYYSIPVGGTLPTIAATAYDSFYKESLPVSIDQSTLDNTTPGLYTVQVVAKNHFGYTGSANVYIGVTNIASALSLAGVYKRDVNGVVANITKLATGMYMTDNVGGVDPVAAPTAVFSAIFVQTNDTTIDFGASQPFSGGTFIIDNGEVSMGADTTFHYIIESPNTIFAQSVRTFVKQ